jgi:Lon protease-like protein
MSVSGNRLPLFPLHTVLFPGMTLPLRVFEPRYVQMVSDCLEGSPLFGVVLIKEGKEVGGPVVPYTVGTTARIIGVERKGQGNLHITTVGERRFQLRGLEHDRPYLVGITEPFPLGDQDAPEVDALLETHAALLTRYLELLSQASAVEIRLQRQPETAEAMAHLVAMLLQVPASVKQRLLSTSGLPALLRDEASLLRGEAAGLTIALYGVDIAERHAPDDHLSFN